MAICKASSHDDNYGENCGVTCCRPEGHDGLHVDPELRIYWRTVAPNIFQRAYAPGSQPAPDPFGG